MNDAPGAGRPRSQEFQDARLVLMPTTARVCPGCGEPADRGAVTVIRDRYAAGRAWHTRCLQREQGLRAEREATRVNRLPQRVGQPPERLTDFESAHEFLAKIGPELMQHFMQSAHEADPDLSNEGLVILAAGLAHEAAARRDALRSRVARDQGSRHDRADESGTRR